MYVTKENFHQSKQVMFLLKSPKLRHVSFAGADYIYFKRNLRGNGKKFGTFLLDRWR